MKWIAGDLLKQDGKTIKDLADILETEGLSYRTVYAYFSRGGGSLEIGAKIARAMGRTLDEVIYIDELDEMQKREGRAVKVDVQSSHSLQDDIIKALVDYVSDTSNRKALSNAAALLGQGKYYHEAGICNQIAELLNKSTNTSDEGV